MKLTVCTAVFNMLSRGQGESVRRCLASVAAVPVAHEHLVFDGGSTDGTVDLLRELAAEHPNVRLVSERDAGIYDALNKGLRAAAGDYFYVLGSDDLIHDPAALAEAVRTGSDADADLVLSPVRLENGTLQPKRPASVFRILRKMGYSHQGVLVRTKLLRRVGGFDLRFRIAGDHHALMRCHLAGGSVVRAWRAYATFGGDGVSSTRRAAAVDDDIAAIADVHGLSPEAARRFRKTGIAPWSLIRRLRAAEAPFLGDCARRLLLTKLTFGLF